MIRSGGFASKLRPAVYGPNVTDHSLFPRNIAGSKSAGMPYTLLTIGPPFVSMKEGFVSTRR
jgi:hypothetical protein